MSALTALQAVDAGSAIERAQALTPSFSQWMAREMQSVNGQLEKSEQLTQDLALGKVDNLHHVMIELEKSRLSLQLMLQIRNHVLDAYNDVVRMQL